MTNEYLRALPHDDSPDCGPRYRGGLALLVLGLLAGLLAVVAGVGASGTGSAAIWLWIIFVVPGGAVALFCLRCALLANRGKKDPLPECRYLLRDDLKFLIHRPLADVAMTAILRPDRAAAGGATTLLIFMENHASRQRRLRLRIAANKSLGIPATRKLWLALAAGQAAVYRLPLQLAANARPGESELKILVRAKNVTGSGVILPSVSGKKYRRPGMAISSRFTLQPFVTVTAAGADAPAAPPAPLAAENFFSLAVPGMTQPRFELLGMISTFPPTQEITLPAPAASTAAGHSPA